MAPIIEILPILNSFHLRIFKIFINDNGSFIASPLASHHEEIFSKKSILMALFLQQPNRFSRIGR